MSGQVKQAEAAAQQAVYQYRRTIFNAFREVEDSLIASVKTREQLASTDRQVKALAQAARVSRLRYEAGLANYCRSSTRTGLIFRDSLQMSSSRPLSSTLL